MAGLSWFPRDDVDGDDKQGVAGEAGELERVRLVGDDQHGEPEYGRHGQQGKAIAESERRLFGKRLEPKQDGIKCLVRNCLFRSLVVRFFDDFEPGHRRAPS